ncbi:MAG: hypothetical protein AMXMBFR64_40540 [Myxococcales bacterium]
MTGRDREGWSLRAWASDETAALSRVEGPVALPVIHVGDVRGGAARGQQRPALESDL